jgi:Menin.
VLTGTLPSALQCADISINIILCTTGNLGDLEEINPTSGRSPCSILFQEGIISSRKYYHNMHVYPYTYQGGYFYRHYMYKEAFESWANASDVIRQ